jgi:dTDP-glucose pyrophosphorylase
VKSFDTDLPERINAIYTITYNVGEVRESLAELNEIEPSEVKDYEITNLIDTWLAEDFHGHEVILQDENGEEVDW